MDDHNACISRRAWANTVWQDMHAGTWLRETSQLAQLSSFPPAIQKQLPRLSLQHCLTMGRGCCRKYAGTPRNCACTDYKSSSRARFLAQLKHCVLQPSATALLLDMRGRKCRLYGMLPLYLYTSEVGI